MWMPPKMLGVKLEAPTEITIRHLCDVLTVYSWYDPNPYAKICGRAPSANILELWMSKLCHMCFLFFIFFIFFLFLLHKCRLQSIQCNTTEIYNLPKPKPLGTTCISGWLSCSNCMYPKPTGTSPLNFYPCPSHTHPQTHTLTWASSRDICQHVCHSIPYPLQLHIISHGQWHLLPNLLLLPPHTFPTHTHNTWLTSIRFQKLTHSHFVQNWQVFNIPILFHFIWLYLFFFLYLSFY